MAKLTSISIVNIKGIKSQTFNFDLYPNKPSILVAPNGFGKSSIACAFKSLKNKHIALNESDFHLGNLLLSPEITVRLDSDTYQATKNSNSISSAIDTFVINSPLYAKSTKRNMGKFTTASASLEISSVILIETVPNSQDFNYSHTIHKKKFGINGKLLPSANDLLNNKDFLYAFEKEININDFTKVKSFKKPMENICAKINQQSGTATKIKEYIKTNLMSDLYAIIPLKHLSELISKFNGSEEIDSYFLAYQIIKLCETSTFKQAINYQLYLKDKHFFNELIASLNSTRHEIKVREVKNKKGKKNLEVFFPKASDISNGQRDILSFIAQIQQAKRQFSKQYCILVIDEIFDYLDDANLVAFQYYVSLMIEEFKTQGRYLYPLLLTHLNPEYFKHFCFNKHKMQIRYLAEELYENKSILIDIVKKRDDSLIKEDISKYFFHFHPENCNLEDKFKSLSLNKKWAQSQKFYLVVEEELKKYLESNIYDPIGVLLAVRIKIEQLAYDNILECQKNNFIEVHKTRSKLDFCVDECNIDIPEIHYLLGIIYNDDLHYRANKNIITPLCSKLANPTIKHMIEIIANKSLYKQPT